jgi:hypothetical protein
MAGATAELITHGPDVGLPSGQMGNSEVGTPIGAEPCRGDGLGDAIWRLNAFF